LLLQLAVASVRHAGPLSGFAAWCYAVCCCASCYCVCGRTGVCCFSCACAWISDVCHSAALGLEALDLE